MSAIPHPAATDRILHRLRQVARRRWGVTLARGVLQALLAAMTIVLVAVLGMAPFLEIPVAVRVTAAVLVWGAVLASIIYFLRPALSRRSLVRTAMDVESQLARTGRRDTCERITSAVELRAEH